MSERDVVLSSRVRLARNYVDLPFDLGEKPEAAAMCVARTVQALGLEAGEEPGALVRLRDLTPIQRQSLAEAHRISRDLLAHDAAAAVLLREDDALSVMMNEEDHLRIQAMCPGLDLPQAAEKCFHVEDELSRHVTFAYDDQLGYLTACPTNTGTGMRASLLVHLPMLTLCKQMGNVGQIVAKVGLTIRGVYGEGAEALGNLYQVSSLLVHLPMLTLCKQMGNVGQIVAKVGLTIRGVYGEGAEALGNLYQVSNQVTLGRTEQELISAVTAVGHQLIDMERALRDKALAGSRINVEDTVFRAWGILRNARILPMNEFFKHWSGVRLGAALSMLPVSLARADALLTECQDAHLCAWEEAALEGAELNAARARRARDMLAQ